MPDDEIYCPCGARIGRVISGPDGRGWLQVGGLRFAHVCGVCVRCGLAFHWSAIPERRLQARMAALVEHAQRVRGGG